MGIGPLLKTWRTKRRLSQLDLALEAGVSTRHLSFLETGRSRPSEQMVLHLAEQLDVPLRERNRMLLAAGYAPSLLAAAARASSGRSRTRSTSCSTQPRAVPGDRRRPRVERRRRQRRDPDAHRGRRAAPARAADQRAAADPAPRGHGAAHREPRPVARAPAARPRGAGRRDRRRRAATRCSRSCGRYPGRRASRASTRSSSRCAIDGLSLPEHPHDVRHRARRHRLRAGDRGVLPRRRETATAQALSR